MKLLAQSPGRSKCSVNISFRCWPQVQGLKAWAGETHLSLKQQSLVIDLLSPLNVAPLLWTFPTLSPCPLFFCLFIFLCHLSNPQMPPCAQPSVPVTWVRERESHVDIPFLEILGSGLVQIPALLFLVSSSMPQNFSAILLWNGSNRSCFTPWLCRQPMWVSWSCPQVGDMFLKALPPGTFLGPRPSHSLAAGPTSAEESAHKFCMWLLSTFPMA